MLTQLPKMAKDVLANAVPDGGIARLLEIAILRLLEGGEAFALADALAVPFYGGVIHSRYYYFVLSHEAYTRFPTQRDECFVVDMEHFWYIGTRHGESGRSFRVRLTSNSMLYRTWIHDVPVLRLQMLVEQLLFDDFYYGKAAVVTLIRAQGLDESFTDQLKSAVHPAYLDCLREVREYAEDSA